MIGFVGKLLKEQFTNMLTLSPVDRGSWSRLQVSVRPDIPNQYKNIIYTLIEAEIHFRRGAR